MRVIELYGEPGEFNLFCPFCGKRVFDSNSVESFSRCKHTLFAGTGNSEIIMANLDEDSIVFCAFESGPSVVEYVFAFREGVEELGEHEPQVCVPVERHSAANISSGLPILVASSCLL